MNLFEELKKSLTAPKEKGEINNLVSRCGQAIDDTQEDVTATLIKALFTTKKMQLRAMEGLEKVINDIEQYGMLRDETFAEMKNFVNHVMMVEVINESSSVPNWQ